MILLDTNLISELMKDRPNQLVLIWLDDQLENELYVSSIIKAEIEYGIALLDEGNRKNKLKLAADDLFGNFDGRCLSLDCQVSSVYAEVMVQSKTLGRPMTVEDAQIAAIAIAHKCKLATRNIKDFDFLNGLRLVNPWLNHSVNISH